MSTTKNPKKPKVKKGEPPPIDKLLKPAIGVALAIVAYQFIRGLGGGIKRVNLANETELREIFFGEGGTGKSYVVLCHAEESSIPISSIFQDAYNDGTVKAAEFRVMDCNYVLPSSEKSVADRFQLDSTKRPTIFLSGAIGAPKQIDEKYLKTGAMLVKFLRKKLESRATKIETTNDLKTRCLDKEYCGLLLKGSKKPPSHLRDAMSKLLKDFPDVGFASIDSSVLYLLNLEDLLPELENGQSRFVVFKKLGGSLEPGGRRLITSYAAIPSSVGVTYAYMNNLVSNVVQGLEQTIKLSTLPVVKTRTKKLEEAEKAKRHRRVDQKQRREQEKTDGSSTSAGGGSSGENDGTAEGRRAERERRRQEHHAKHNVKPKTPEEIAEMERRRRARMEEEAAKWNVAPDDAPEQGDPIPTEEGGEGDFMEDIDSADLLTSATLTDDEDDEDVIDLD